ncbi:MAG: vitamin K epoxide reductase [Actinomycetota bacterium]|nr:vitamin K epoxide reductase [Actinomycetota bacterium]
MSSETTRQHPAGPPAREVRPTSKGIGRGSSIAAERVSDDLRRGAGDFLEQRRRVSALTLASMAALGVVAAYQNGLIRRPPEPRVSPLDAERVDASGEAYQLFRTPDAALGLLSGAATLVLAGIGDRGRSRSLPLVPLALAVKAAVDATSAGVLTVEQMSKHRRFCSWCLVAAAANLAAFPLTLPEAKASWRRLRGQRRAR